MNTADYCPEGRERYAAYLALRGYDPYGLIQFVKPVREAYRRWQEHIKDCYECKGK